MISLISLMLMVMLAGSGSSSRPRQVSEPPGKAAYARVCQVCHGAEGRGDAGPGLVPLDKDYEDVLTIVREGGGQMPPISAERVSDGEVRQIVEYLKSLKGAEQSPAVAQDPHASHELHAIPAEQRRAVEGVEKLLIKPKWTEIGEVAQRPN